MAFAGPATAPSKSASGVWAFTLDVGGLKISSVATLKQDGKNLTGSVLTGEDKEATEISGGKLTEQIVEFTVDLVREVGTLRTIYRGKMDGDQIRGTAEIGWIDVPDHKGTSKVDWVATRAKDSK